MPKRNENFAKLLDENLAIAYDRQIHLNAQIGEWDWLLDVDEGTISFTKRQILKTRVRSAPIQILGYASHVSDTWHWPWANDQQRDPESLLEAARALRG